MPKFNKPQLVNRGPAGLLKKLPKTGEQPQATKQDNGKGALNNIALSLRELVVPISQLTPDPMNARLHPERNMEAIVDSLKTYGQVKPIVVRKSNNVVVAGNGTLEAAKSLGWTEIAASMVDMDDVQAAGYGLADNRTAELAKWDFEVVARIDKLLHEAGQSSIGWSLDELEVLRAADWTPPAIGDFNDDDSKTNRLILSFTPDQFDRVKKALELLRLNGGQGGIAEKTQEECVCLICDAYVAFGQKSRK